MGHHDSKKMLDICIYDYLTRKQLHKSAEIFAEEANVSPNKVAMAPPEGLLREWWSIFWDTYSAQVQNVALQATQSSTAVGIAPDLISQLSEVPTTATSVTSTVEQTLLPMCSTNNADQLALVLPSSSGSGNSPNNVSIQRPVSVTRSEDDGQGSMMAELKSQLPNLARQETEIPKQHKPKPAHNVSREGAKSTKSIRNKKSR